jgi:hypothetical protein
MASTVVAPDRRGRLGAVVVIGVCATLLAVTALVGLAPAVKARLGWTESAQSSYLPGDSIDVPPSLYQGQQTLIVFASGTCGACRRSEPALGSLAKELRGSATRFLLITPNTRIVDQQALIDAVGLERSEVSALDLSSLRLKIVPSVVLVDRSGRILYSHEGLIDEDGSVAIRRAVDGSKS